MDEDYDIQPKRPRKPYKPPMGCMARAFIWLIVIVVVLAGAVFGFFKYAQRENPGLTLKEFLTFAWRGTKKTVGEYKDKGQEKWVDFEKWLEKSKKTQAWLDTMFPSRKVSRSDEAPEIATGKETGGRNPDIEKIPRTGAVANTPDAGARPNVGTPVGVPPNVPAAPKPAPGPDWNKQVHPEFQSAADDFRAGLVLLQKRKFKAAFDAFERSQDHLEEYKKVNPGDPRIVKFEEELTLFKHTALKDAGWSE